MGVFFMGIVITLPNQIGEILRGRRKARRLPQQELAEKLGISQAQFSKLEKDPSSLTLDRLLLLVKLLDLEVIVEPRESRRTPSRTRTTEW
jgi:HTH-type transcriptional regulator/antitoxin HipB